MIRKAIIIFAILVLLSMVYGCITINQISPSGTTSAPATSPVPPTTTPPTTSPPPLTSIPPLTNIPPLTTIPPVTTVPPFILPPLATIPAITEDCNSFNYVNTQSQFLNGRWLVVSGGQSLLNFEGNQAGADLAVNIIKFYAMTSQCFVGRPNAPMTYFLSNGSAPVGAYPGEDAITINPANVSAQLVNGNWTLVDGSSLLVNFQGSQANANIAVAIVQKYGFTRMCFVGRNNPPVPMMYFRK